MIRLLNRFRTWLFSLLRMRTLGTAVIAIDESERVVLVKLSYGGHSWQLPGGGVHRSESFRTAALREAREEAGIELGGGTAELLGVYLRSVGHWRDHVAVFVLRGWTQQSSDSWEIDRVQRFAISDLPPDIGQAASRRIAEATATRTIDDRW